MLIQGNQGQTGKQVGQNIVASVGEYGENLVTELQPRYYEQAYRGNIFSLTYAAAALALVSTAQSGAFTLYNPVSSGKNLVMLDYIAGVTVTTTAAATANINVPVIMGGFSVPQPTGLSAALTPTPTLIGSGNHSVAAGYTTATLAANAAYPAAVRQVQNINLNTTIIFTAKDEIAGLVIVPPGCGINLYSGFAATFANFSITPTYTWAEIPI